MNEKLSGSADIANKIRNELAQKHVERAEALAKVADLDASIARGEELIRALSAYETDGLGDETDREQKKAFGGSGSGNDPLEQIARSGFGSATRGVVALLSRSADGVSARDLIDAIAAARFNVRNADTAVRSALKNLRDRKQVEFVEATGRYRLISRS